MLQRVSEIESATFGFLDTDLELVNQHRNGIKFIILTRLHIGLSVDTEDWREDFRGSKGATRKMGPG